LVERRGVASWRDAVGRRDGGDIGDRLAIASLHDARTGAKAPVFVAVTTSNVGVRVGGDEGVTEAVAVVAQLGGVLRRVLAAAIRGAERGDRAFGPIGGLRLLRGAGPLLDFGWVEHVTPGPGDRPYRPGPPLHVRYRFAGTEYTR
jgi:hypothetical protein